MMRAALSLTAGYLLVADLPARGADCSSDKGHDSSYWSWRIIDGKKCWYRGRPGRSKAELHWPVNDTPTGAAKQGGVKTGEHLDPVIAPSVEPATATPEPPWRASDADQLLAFTCCWPQLDADPNDERSLMRPAPTAVITPPHEVNWWWALLPIAAYMLWRLFGLNFITGGLQHDQR